MKDADVSSYVRSKVKSYSSATLHNTERIDLRDEPNAIVGRYIKSSEINKIFKERRDIVKQYVGYALEAEQKLALDNALRYLYWASSLLKTVQYPKSFKYKVGNDSVLLYTWIPKKIDDIINDIRVSVISKDDNDVNLFFSYNGKPVSSLDYHFFNGQNWSDIYSAKDGRGIVELLPGNLTEDIQLKFEYMYVNQAKLYDKEVASAVAVVKGGTGKAKYKGRLAVPSADGTLADGEMVARVDVPKIGEVSSDKRTACKRVVDRIISAIQGRDYESVRTLFTNEGYDIFLRLMQYGNARVLQQREYTYTKLSDQTVVRSVPMSFKFTNGAMKSFVEDVVFTFDSYGKIDNITFGLGDVATADIMSQSAFSEEMRSVIVNFLEVYKTAFALKRIDYIESVFDDNAVIITGRVLLQGNNGDADVYASNRVVRLTRQTKVQYIKNLRANFRGNEFINIRFDRTTVQKAQNKEVYGIQLQQDYYSSTYGDSGYLYLQIDMTDSSQPIIKVRTWQDHVDSENPQIGMYDF